MKSRAIYSDEPARGWIPWGALAPFLAFVFVVGPLYGITEALIHFQLANDTGNPIGVTGLFAFLLLPFSAVGLLVLGWVRFVERRPLVTIGLTRNNSARYFLRGLAIGCATIIVLLAASWLAGGYEALAFGKALSSPAALLNIAILLVCFTVQSSAEELVFRGWLLSTIARKFNVPLAVILSSAVFCLLHYGPGQPWLVTLNLVLFASFACTWVLRTGNIWGVMGWHSGWNWLLATGFELPVTGIESRTPALLVELAPLGSNYLTGGAQGPEGSIFTTVFFLTAIAWMLWLRPRSRDSPDQHVP